MRYLSICSGIEAASVAWRHLGWKPAALSDIDPFSKALLAHRFPGVPLYGNFTTIDSGDCGSVDLLVGGTPCQSFSTAGLRGGLGDDRGNLAIEFARLASRIRPRWIVWENVPGVLSSNRGRDFGAILGALEQFGYGWSYRILDAQYFGVPQRRRRVFVVGHLADWRRAAAVLFESNCIDGNPPSPKVEGDRLQNSFWWNGSQVSHTLDSVLYKKQAMPEKNRFPAVITDGQLRWITPVEAERLQGFPDDWTLVPYQGGPAEDRPRYKALGNSMAVPVMRWIGERIAMVEQIK